MGFGTGRPGVGPGAAWSTRLPEPAGKRFRDRGILTTRYPGSMLCASAVRGRTGVPLRAVPYSASPPGRRSGAGRGRRSTEGVPASPLAPTACPVHRPPPAVRGALPHRYRHGVPRNGRCSPPGAASRPHRRAPRSGADRARRRPARLRGPVPRSARPRRPGGGGPPVLLRCGVSYMRRGPCPQGRALPFEPESPPMRFPPIAPTSRTALLAGVLAASGVLLAGCGDLSFDGDEAFGDLELPDLGSIVPSASPEAEEEKAAGELPSSCAEAGAEELAGGYVPSGASLSEDDQ